MSIFDKIKHGVEHAAHEAKHAAEHAAHDVEHGVKHAAHEVEHGAKKGEQAVEHEAKEVGGQVSDILKAVENGLHQIESKALEGVHEVEQKTLEGVHAVEKAATAAEHAVEHAVHEVLEAVAQALTKEALGKARDMARAAHTKLDAFRESQPALVSAIDEVGFDLSLGPITMSYSSFYGRSEALVGVLDHYASQPPALKRGPILDLIRAIAPDSFDFGISVELALVIGSDELGVGASLSSIPSALGIELADLLLEKLGVPA